MFDNPQMMTLLRDTLHEVKGRYPFIMLGYVFLPDHFHVIIKPEGNNNFSQIMHSLKFNFTKSYKKEINHNGHLQFWQKRFWDHVIRNEIDLENHIHYIHYNPIKHGYVKGLRDWNDSSFDAWQKRGAYPENLNWQEPLEGVWGE